MINIENLKYNKNNDVYEDGYRIVYFYKNGDYHIGEYCKTIEGFMIGFTENNPIMSDDDIPEFISIEDLLIRCSKFDNDAIEIALYSTDGKLIDKIDIAEKEKTKN